MSTSPISVAILLAVFLGPNPQSVSCTPTENVTKTELAKCGVSRLVSGVPLNTSVGKTGEVADMSVSEGDFPWHAVLYQKRSEKWEQVCGGTLVTPRIVLTGAICVTEYNSGARYTAKPPQTVKVTLGKLSRSWNKTEMNQVTRDVSQIRLHPNFIGTATNFAFDLALLTLESDVPTSEFIMPACLDLTSVYNKQFNEDKALKGYLTGFGNTGECESGEVCEPLEHLRYVETNVVDYNTCADALLKSKNSVPLRIAPDHFCVGNGTVSPVQRGDSGGGLTLVFNGLHYVFGVVSIKLKLEIGDKLYYSYGGLTSIPYNIAWLKSELE